MKYYFSNNCLKLKTKICVMNQLSKKLFMEIKTPKPFNAKSASTSSQPNPADHPYILYIRDLNMTQCYKEMLLADNKQIVKLMPDEYKELRKDFEEKHPDMVTDMKKIQPSDCTIL